jgi:hypothetical protein
VIEGLKDELCIHLSTREWEVLLHFAWISDHVAHPAAAPWSQIRYRWGINLREARELFPKTVLDKHEDQRDVNINTRAYIGSLVFIIRAGQTLGSSHRFKMKHLVVLACRNSRRWAWTYTGARWWEVLSPSVTAWANEKEFFEVWDTWNAGNMQYPHICLDGVNSLFLSSMIPPIGLCTYVHPTKWGLLGNTSSDPLSHPHLPQGRQNILPICLLVPGNLPLAKFCTDRASI